MTTDVFVAPARQAELLEQWRSDITGEAVTLTSAYCAALADSGDPVTQILMAVLTSHAHDIGRMRQRWSRAVDAMNLQFVAERMMRERFVERSRRP